MTSKLTNVATWGYFVFIVFATLSPLHLRPTLTEREPGFIVVLERFGAFAVLGFLLSINYPNRIALVCAIVFGSIVTLELAQNLIPDRDPRLIDATEKLAGGGFGVFTARWLVLRFRENSFKIRE